MRPILAAGHRVVAIRDTPSPRIDIPKCLAAHPTDYASCNMKRSYALPPDPLVTAIAAMRSPLMITADMTRYFCYSLGCPGAIGGVTVYIDSSHITDTYARTVTAYLSPAIMRVF